MGSCVRLARERAGGGKHADMPSEGWSQIVLTDHGFTRIVVMKSKRYRGGMGTDLRMRRWLERTRGFDFHGGDLAAGRLRAGEALDGYARQVFDAHDEGR